METRGKVNLEAPEIKAYLNELARQFVREGVMVAFPLCIPGMTTPIPHDESRITALAVSSEEQIYGGTSGRQAHLFAAAFHGVSGIVFDAGVVPDCTETAAVCCSEQRVIAFANGPRGGRAVVAPLINLAQDWIQEWGLQPPILTDLGECVPGEPVVHAVAVPEGKMVVGVTTSRLFTVDVETGAIRIVGEAPGRGQLAVGPGAVFGQDDGAPRLWRFDASSREVIRGAIDLPDGKWTGSLRWARDRYNGMLFTADAGGNLFSFDGDKEFRSVGKAHLAPVGPMAATADGRLFGFCGEEMANLFCCDTTSGLDVNLGVAASVLEKRRYGYQFGAAITGRDGELVFGEDDNGGHLWLYFPKIMTRTGSR